MFHDTDGDALSVAVLIVIGVFAIIGVLIGISAWLDRKRGEELKKVADELGLTFLPEGSSELAERLSAFALFNSGHGRKQARLIQGESDEVTISIFDYQYTTGSGKQSQTHRQSVAAMCSSEIQIPDFTLRAEHMWDKLGGLIGMSDINFDSHPTFSGMFVLKGSNEEAIRKFFTPAVLTFFERHKGASVEAAQGALIFYQPGRKVAAREIRDFLSQAYEIYGVVVDNR